MSGHRPRSPSCGAGSRARPPVDPRILERRIEVRRQDARRRLRLTAAVAALSTSLAAGWGLTRSPVLDVDRVRVRGVVRTTVTDVVAATRLAHRPAMLDVRSADVARRVGRLPWVEQVSVQRRWPGTVEVEVTERQPVAAVEGAAGGWALVDAGGRVLAIVAEPERGLVPLRPAHPPGPPGARVDPATSAALGVASALGGPLVDRVSAVSVQPSGHVDITVPPRTTVRLGPPTAVEEKLLALATLAEHVDLRGVTVVDLRVPSAPVLTRTPGTG